MQYKFGTDALFGNYSTSIPADINYFQEAFNLTAEYAVVGVPYAQRGGNYHQFTGIFPKATAEAVYTDMLDETVGRGNLKIQVQILKETIQEVMLHLSKQFKGRTLDDGTMSLMYSLVYFG